MGGTNVVELAERAIMAHNLEKAKNLKDGELITFPKSGLIPEKKFIWRINRWLMRGAQSGFLVSEHLRSKDDGGIFYQVDPTFTEKNIVKQNCPGNPKILMGYVLDRDMTEGEILIKASDLKIRREQKDLSGRKIFSTSHMESAHQIQRNNSVQEVDAHDLYRIAHAHEVLRQIRLPINLNFHFFPDLQRIDHESGKVTFTSTHMCLRNSTLGLIANASKFSPGHVWKKGDVCVFSLHEVMRPKIC